MSGVQLISSIGVFVALSALGCAADAPPSRAPNAIDRATKVLSLPEGVSYLAASDGHLFGQAHQLRRVFVWDWAALEAEPRAVPVLCPLDSVAVANGHVISVPIFIDMIEVGSRGNKPNEPVRPEFVQAHKANTSVMEAEPYLKEYQRLPGRPLFKRKAGKAEAEVVECIPQTWYVRRMRAAHDGLAVAICLAEDCGVTGGDRDREKIRIGLYDDKAHSVSWVDGLAGQAPVHYPLVQSLALTRDTSIIGVIGDNGNGGWVACIDVANKKVLWEQRNEKGTVGFYGGDFSVDGKTLFVGGTMGKLYGYDIATGKRVSEWPLPDRIECVVTSPDGKLLAVGLVNAYGTVCLVDPAKGTVVRSITTGLNAIRGLGWSPDSTMLAVAGAAGKEIRIYQIADKPSPVAPSQPTVPAPDAPKPSEKGSGAAGKPGSGGQ